MKKFESIILSDTAPSICSLWLNKGKLYYFNNGTWNEIATTTATPQPEPLVLSTDTDKEW